MSELHTSHKEDLPSLSIRRPVLIIVLNLLIIIAGLSAILGLEVRELPDVDRPVVSIRASYPGGAPETVDTEVTSRLEGAAARVSGVKSIRAQSEEGFARVVIEFRPGINIEDAANETREAISQVQRQLPDEVERLAIVKADNDAGAVVSLTLSSDSIEMESLTEMVETDIAPLFLSIPGVADIRINGEREKVLRVTVDPIRLASFALSFSDVASALRTAPFDVPAGSLRSTDQQVIVRADATSITASEVENILISGNTRVGDVANVYFGPADANSFVRLNGKPVIGLEILRQAGANTIEISDQTQAMVEELRHRFPSLEIHITDDDAQFIRGSIEEVLTSLSFTIALVVFTLWLFLGSFRATIIPALSIPVSLIGSLAVMWMLGFSINILTLLALVLATGLIVDDAIVVSENIQRRKSLGLASKAAAVIGSREVFFAVVATTAVLVAVFVPIAFLPSTAGRLFREFGGVLSASVIISSFVALTLVPAFKAKIPTGNNKTMFSGFGNACLTGYKTALGWCLTRGFVVLLLSVVAAGGAVAIYDSVKKELLPPEDRGNVRIFARGPDGVGIAFMDRQAEKMEDTLLPYMQDGNIETIKTVVGQWDPNIVYITVNLKDWEQRSKSQQDIIAEIRPELNKIPGAPGRAFGPNSLNLRGQGGGLEFAITGNDYDEIYDVAQDFSKALENRFPQMGRAEISYQPTQPQMRVHIDRRRAEELGVPFSDITNTLRSAIGGYDLGNLNVGDQAIPIMLQSTYKDIADPADLTNLYVGSGNGSLVPLSSIAYITEEGVAAELERHAQRRAIEVDVDLPDSISMEEAVTGLRELAQDVLPDGFGLVFLGEALTFRETDQQVNITYLVAFIIVLLVLAAQFESFNSALVVMITVPFGIAAAIYAVFLTGTSINVYSQIGLVMLIGLLAKNSILLVEFADQLRDQGHSVKDAILKAGEVRLRPIMMTLMSTILGGIPLIVSSGAGAEARNAIGWVVFGGLGLAVVFTLFLTPVLYFWLARFVKPRKDNAKQLETELQSAGEKLQQHNQ
ncbi:efflux RND transporter permease subunit [Planctobacterium marinum]|uniref:efflux RND transporter permease subunit n=1 Tax=Planctobacterium marinum TaxID=1631968 RepID=UPI001E48CAAD|nr:efflux RND transporter permease subunit [Planctobacterium marinum]MCC2604349.1 efflux RND transporter permease subunit [Planctobacterium marinum]